MNDWPDTPVELRARALRLLARREHSRAELDRKLLPHAESSAALEVLLSDLEKRKQLSNERFAAERARVLSRKYGAASIRQDLKARGIPPEIADLLVKESVSSDLQRAEAILVRKYRAPAITPKDCARRIRFLMSRGFSSEVSQRAIRLALGFHTDE